LPPCEGAIDKNLNDANLGRLIGKAGFTEWNFREHCTQGSPRRRMHIV